MFFLGSWEDEGNEMIDRSHCHGDVKQYSKNFPQFFFKNLGFPAGNFGLFGRAGIHGILFLPKGFPRRKS